MFGIKTGRGSHKLLTRKEQRQRMQSGKATDSDLIERYGRKPALQMRRAGPTLPTYVPNRSNAPAKET